MHSVAEKSRTTHANIRPGGITEKKASKRYTPEKSDVARVTSGQGFSLESGDRAFMEDRFGYDFGDVRIHNDADAANSASRLDARAYTFGSRIVFGAGEYAPQTEPGMSLLAHELAHVVQQGGVQPVMQAKPVISGLADEHETVADDAAGRVMAWQKAPSKTSALAVRDSLRKTAVQHPVVQRAAKTWGGQFDTSKYQLTNKTGLNGVDIELKFTPGKYVNATLIGMTQTARSYHNGSAAPASRFYSAAADQSIFESRRVKNGAHAGTMIDQLVQFKNPLYATGAAAAQATLSSTPTHATWGQHGYYYKDGAGTLKQQDALLKDTPQLSDSLQKSGQTFETTALAIQGVQQGAFYGSVRWGWKKDASGTVSKLPLTLVSKDVPSSLFAKAAELWNKGTTSKSSATLDLPMISAKYTTSPGVWLVSDPSHYRTTIVGKLEKRTRVEVIDKGEHKPYNHTSDTYKWWKVTVVGGSSIGKVGWVMQTLLAD